MSSKKKSSLKWIIFILSLLAGSVYFFKDRLPILNKDTASSIDHVYVDSDGIEQRAITRNGAFINFGDRYPNHDFSIVIWGDVEKQDLPPTGQHLCVKGLVSEYKGKPQIELKNLNAQIYYNEN